MSTLTDRANRLVNERLSSANDDVLAAQTETFQTDQHAAALTRAVGDLLRVCEAQQAMIDVLILRADVTEPNA